nr:prolyl oligopeptidase family serine peptidase [Longispora albida]
MERGGFVNAYPDGADHAWNAGGGCCGELGRSDVDDVAFLSAVVAEASRNTSIDPSKVYATGMSNGAMMAYRLACETTLFAAIAPVSGTMLVPCASPAPVSVLHIHDTADRNVPYAGGEGEGVAHINGPSIEPAVDSWRRVNLCGTNLTSTYRHPVTRTTVSCRGGAKR